jgi:hypothetical protein
MLTLQREFFWERISRTAEILTPLNFGEIGAFKPAENADFFYLLP